MALIFFNNSDEFNIDIIYSKSYSRPSKSLLTPDIYNKFKIIKDENIFLNFTNDELIKECIHYMYDSYIITNNDIIIANKTYSKIELSSNYFSLIENINKNKDNFAFILKEIYTYPKIQFIYILGKHFENVTLSLSQFHNFGVLLCENKISQIDLELDKHLNVKDFNIRVPETILSSIKKYNDLLFKRTIEINDKIINTCNSVEDLKSLNKEMEILNKYYKLYISKQLLTNCNNCKLIYSIFLDCCICQNCYNLFT